MNTHFEYKLNGKVYKCNFGFKFIEVACDAKEADLDTISEKVFGVKSKKTKKKDKDGNWLYEPETLPTFKMVSIAYHLLYFGIIANDELEEKASSIKLKDCTNLVFGNSEKLVQVYNDAFSCTMSFLVGQDIKDIDVEDSKGQKKRPSQSKKRKK